MSSLNASIGTKFDPSLAFLSTFNLFCLSVTMQHPASVSRTRPHSQMSLKSEELNTIVNGVLTRDTHNKLVSLGLALILCTVLALPLSAQSEEYNAYTYDAAGRLLSVNYGRGQGISYTYDNSGNLLQRAIVTFPNLDGDLMDDEWEVLHFGNTDRDGMGDFDKDSQSDLAEFLSNTDPTDANSLLRITESSLSEGGGLTVEWDSVAGLTYQLQFKEDLNDAAWFKLGDPVVATSGTATQNDPDASASAPRFYRVLLIP